MATIVVSPLVPEEEPTPELLQLEIFVKNEDWLGFFDVIEVWRSRQTAAGPFEELTADDWIPARIPKDAPDPPVPPIVGPSINIVGKPLQLRVNELDDLVIIFTGIDPLTFATVASQITAQGLTKVGGYVIEGGEIALQTSDAGTGAVLRIVGGEAAVILGLPTEEPSSLSFGKDARIPLIEHQQLYPFTDINGSVGFFYKTRFRNRTTGATSEFSQPFGVGSSAGVTQINLACGQLDLVSIDGKPLIRQEVRVHMGFNGSIVDGRLLGGSDISKRTNDDGHVEFILVRGQKVTVAIVGTDLVREIIVPVDQAIKVFNLLDPSVGTGDDFFKVRVPQLIFAERRTL